MPLKEIFPAASKAPVSPPAAVKKEPAVPDTFECGGALYMRQEDGTWCVAGFQNPRPYLQLVRTVYDQPVVRILPGAFRGCDTIYELRMREGIREIGRGAFDGCTKLRLLALPASLTHIEGLLPNIGAKLFEDETAAFWAAQQNDPWARKAYGLYDPIIVESKPGEIIVVKGSYAERYCRENGIRCIAK